MLTGKHSARRQPAGSPLHARHAGPRTSERYWHDREFAAIEALRKVADGAGMELGDAGDTLGDVQSRDHRADRRRQPARQLADSLAAAEQGPFPEDLKAKLDDITREWRGVDAER